jgi:hypothetical protein
LAKKDIHLVRGTVHWAKVLGDPVPNYGGDNREWTLDFTPDEDSMKTFKELGLDERIKNKDDEPSASERNVEMVLSIVALQSLTQKVIRGLRTS